MTHGAIGRGYRAASRGVAMAIVLALVAACSPTEPPQIVTNPNLPTNTARVTRGRVQTTVSASGTVSPLQEVFLNFPASQTVKQVNAAVGGRVRAGDILGQADATSLRLALAQQEGGVITAQAKLDQTAMGAIQKDIDVARSNVESARAKLQAIVMGATQKDIDIAQSNVESARAKFQATAMGASRKDIDVARANLDSAIAQYNAVANPSPKDLEVARANLDSAIASYNATVNGMTTPQDIANGEASVRSAQAKLDALRNGTAKQDVVQAQSKVSQAQQSLDKTRSDSSNAKEQARINWEKSADATRSAQRSFDIANATYQQAARTNMEVSASAGSPGVRPPTITPLRLETLKQMADAAYLSVQMAEKTQEQNRLTYENSKNSEVQNVATGQQQLNDAQSALGKLVSGPTQEDVTQAQAAVDQAKSSLDKLKRGPTAEDIAKAQATVDSARSNYNELLRGPKATDLAQRQAAVDSARATLNDLLAGAKNTDLVQAQATVDSAVATLNDLKAGPKATDVTQAQATVDSAVATLNDLLAGPKGTDVAQARAALDQARAARDVARLNLDLATVTAPFGGVITAVNVVVGQTTGTGGSTAATTSFDLIDDSRLHIDVSVSELDSANVAVGQTATVALDSAPGQTVTAVVERVNPNATTTSNVTSFTVRVVLQNPPVQVRPGATSTVTIVTASRQNVLVVPVRAVQSVSGQQAATVVFQNSTFLVPVRTGLSDGRNIEIVSGLNEGDVVVVPRAGAGAGGAGGAGGAPAGGPPR